MSHSRGALPKENHLIMDGRTTELRRTIVSHEPDASRPPDATESAEMTELLHHLVTEVARVHRGESDGAPLVSTILA